MGASNNLKSRTIIALFYVPVMLLFFYLGGIYFKLFFSVLALFFIYEIVTVFQYKYLFIPLIIFIIFLIYIKDLETFWFSILFFIFIFPFLIHFFIRVNPKELSNILIFTVLLIYIASGLKFSILFRNIYGEYMTIFVLLSIWIYDNFAYFTGVKYGKNKIFPKLSPKKSLEGVIGGLTFNFFLGGIMGIIIILITDINSLSPKNLILIFLKMGLLSSMIGITSQFGDLFESFFKRYLKIKDFSHILGAHGGFLDRFDSILFVYPIMYFIMSKIQ